MRLIGKAGGDRDIADADIGAPQQAARGLEPPITDQFLRRLTRGRLDGAQKG